MQTKTLLITLGLSAFLFSIPTMSFAQSLTPAGNSGINRKEMRMQTKTSTADTKLTTLKQKGDQLIGQRLTSLNTMLTRINGLTRLSADQKTTYTTNITNDINGLNSLKVKLDADTDGATALADIKSMYTTYRVYAEFDPQTNMLATTDALKTAIAELTQVATKLQTRITVAGSSGNTVTTLNTLLTDMQSKIADAQTQVNTIQTDVSTLTPEAFNSNPIGTHTTLLNARNSLKTARTDLQTAMQDARQIVLGLKAFKATNTATPSAGTTMFTPTP
jgi:hypothetical protein